jgi:hypothetical protein
MKNALLLSFVLVAGVAMAQKPEAPEKATGAPAAAKPAAKAVAKTHELQAEFISADATKKTITLKAEDGSEKTVPVEGTKTLASLKTLKANEQVTVTCRDNEKGDLSQWAVVVTAIKPTAKK